MTEPHIPLRAGAEFQHIRRMLDAWGPAASGIGDDAATLSIPVGEHLVVSTDTSLENVHFREGWLTPREIGYRSTTAALSDLAAMGANPLGIVVALTLPARLERDLEQLAEGIGEAVLSAGTVVVGGDLTAGPLVSLTVTVLGSVRHPLVRTAASAGDLLYVTGVMGGPLRALRAWERGEVPRPEDRARFARPVARLREAQWLARHGVRAAIDISDGLGSELDHLAQASRVALHVDPMSVPSMGADWRDAMTSGEEYELLIASPSALDADEFRERFGIPLTRIGRVVASTSPAVLLEIAGNRVDLPVGHDHFSS